MRKIWLPSGVVFVLLVIIVVVMFAIYGRSLEMGEAFPRGTPRIMTNSTGNRWIVEYNRGDLYRVSPLLDIDGGVIRSDNESEGTKTMGGNQKTIVERIADVVMLVRMGVYGESNAIDVRAVENALEAVTEDM